MKTALLAGATGLIGKELLQLLLKDQRYSEVKAIVRKPLDIDHPKLKVLVINFDKMDEHAETLGADDVFCCLGTTMKQAKTKEAFKKVDYQYPVVMGRLAKALGAKRYALVSALGANEHSTIFYNKVKGETERAVSELGYDSVHIFRPSLLLGDRVEERSGESAAKVFYKIFGFLIPTKYQGIEGNKVARAMLALSQDDKNGVFIHESKSLQSY